MNGMPPLTTNVPPMVSPTHSTERLLEHIFIRIFIALSVVIVIMIVFVITGVSVWVYSVVRQKRREKRRQYKDITVDNMDQSSTANRELLPGISSNSQPISRSQRTRKISTNVGRFLHPTLDYIPFNGPEIVGSVQVVPCTNLGGIFHFNEHSIFLKIPKDAVPNEVDLEIGVAIHGQFKFPENIRPISAILWLKLPDNFQFQKPIQIQLPHYLGLSKEEVWSSSELGYMLATSGIGELNKNIYLQEGQNDQVDFYQRYGRIKAYRAGYMCLCASRPLIESRSEYFLVSAVPNLTPSLRWTIRFFVVYSLETFIEVYIIFCCIIFNNSLCID